MIAHFSLDEVGCDTNIENLGSYYSNIHNRDSGSSRPSGARVTAARKSDKTELLLPLKMGRLSIHITIGEQYRKHEPANITQTQPVQNPHVQFRDCPAMNFQHPEGMCPGTNQISHKENQWENLPSLEVANGHADRWHSCSGMSKYVNDSM